VVQEYKQVGHGNGETGPNCLPELMVSSADILPLLLYISITHFIPSNSA